ncbi:MAG: metallophosphoesterase family protein [Eubacteriales bacterium]
MKIKFIHTADLHLGRPFANASFPMEIARRRRQEQWETFNDIIRLALEETVDFLWISGDLFEKDFISMGEIKRVHQAFKRIPQVEIIIIAGNHDPYGKKCFYYDYPWDSHVHIIQEDRLTVLEFAQLDTAVYGVSWKEQYMTEDILGGEIPESQCLNKILLMHGDIYHKQSQYLPIDAEKLSTMPFHYVALGHIHKKDSIQHHIRYCGSPEPLDFGEVGEHGILLGELSGKDLQVDFVSIAKRQFIIKNIQLNPDMSYDEITEQILELSRGEKNLYRIILKGMVDSDIPLEELLSDVERSFYHLEWINETVPDYDLEKIALENEDNVIGAFVREMIKKDLKDSIVKDALFMGLEVLLKERDM